MKSVDVKVMFLGLDMVWYLLTTLHDNTKVLIVLMNLKWVSVSQHPKWEESLILIPYVTQIIAAWPKRGRSN